MGSVIPEVIECQVLHNGQPIQGLMLLVRLETTRKNPYMLVFGPTDENGRAVLPQAELERQAAATMSFALMDYVPLATGFTGTVELSVMEEEELDRALRAYERFREFADYPPNYQANIARAKEIVHALGPGADFTLQASALPSSIRVVVVDE